MWYMEDEQELTLAQEWEVYEEEERVIARHKTACKVDGFCYVCQCM